MVFAAVGDPLGIGLISNLARPCGNITGFAATDATLSANRLELLKEMSPSISRATLMFNPETSTRVAVSAFLSAAARLAIEPTVAEVRNHIDVESAIAALTPEPKGGLVIGQDHFMVANRSSIIASVAKHGVPAVYPYSYFSLEGGLMSYGVDPHYGYPQAAGYVSRILKGERAGDLPVQLPTKFQLILNVKTAKVLGITTPASLRARADEVIE